MRQNVFVIAVISLMMVSGMAAYGQEGDACQVLVVMGYHADLRLSQELKAGLEEVFSGQGCEATYQYLDVLRHPEQVEANAQNAFEVYQTLQPDGVIAANDDTQAHFVVPFLKDQVSTPVVFCEVLAPPEEFGYPASNVTGVLIRPFLQQTLEFLTQVAPAIQSVGLIGPKLPLVETAYRRVTDARSEFQVTILDPLLGRHFEETLEHVQALRDQTDALFIAPLYDQQQTQQLLQTYGKATATTKRELIEYGVLCGVIENTKEEAVLAANILVKAMQDTPISELPITTNEFGRRIINVNTLQELGIKPRREILIGTDLVKTVE